MAHRILRAHPGAAARGSRAPCLPGSALTWRRRAAARLVTGPLAHFYAGMVDWVTLLARYGWARARGRDLV